jgi:hypothetical protein
LIVRVFCWFFNCAVHYIIRWFGCLRLELGSMPLAVTCVYVKMFDYCYTNFMMYAAKLRVVGMSEAK